MAMIQAVLDEKARKDAVLLDDKFEAVMHAVETHLNNGKPKSMVITKIQEAHMWVQKSLIEESLLRSTIQDPPTESVKE